jgi:hypothetical protein
MKNLFVSFIALIFIGMVSCNHEPTEDAIKDEIRMHYMGQSMAVGGGSWHPDEVNILKKETDKRNKSVWLITAETKGTYESPPLGNPVPDEAFCDTLKFEFKKNEKGIWVSEMVY